MKLRIGQIAPMNVPIPPKKYGGTERIIDAVCNGLTKRGHEVFIFTAKGATTNAKLIPVIPNFLWTSKLKEATPYYAYEMSVVVKESARLRLDVLHDHLGPWTLSIYNSLGKIPMVHTLHVPTTPPRAWTYKQSNSKLISISNNQRLPAPDLNYISTIYNGTDTGIYKYNPHPKNYLAFVGELVERKGALDAIHIAQKLNAQLLIAGRIPLPVRGQQDDYDFFHKFIKGQLNRGKIKYVGELGSKELAKVYGNAAATLFPIHWEEPFGLVMTESMSCGTPIIAFDRGSVREIVVHGQTGFITKTQSQMLAAVKKVGTINRLDCRRRVEDHFSIEKMVDAYEDLFYKLAKKRR